MRVDQAIASMRGDRTIMDNAQAKAIASARQWRERPGIAPLFAELKEYGRGAPLSSCRQLARLIQSGEAARQFVESFCMVQFAVLAETPFAQVPFRHAYDEGRATLLIAREGTAQLTLAAIEPGSYPANTAVLSDAVRHEVVLAGLARARRLRLQEGSFEREELSLAAGARLNLDLMHQALLVSQVHRRLVVMRLVRTSPHPQPTREYEIASGRLLHQASGDIRTSRHEMMLELLGRMGRSEAASEIAQMALEPGADSLRWQALREALALDSAAGFAALCRIARTTDDPLAMSAGALRMKLLDDHPQLAGLEEAECRA